ncbi:Appr-1-p processing enzyme family protein [Aphelenchoides avenae]|nr:Appr-1-p processing enzyme family protein [Aphelenchus avenae]
MESFVARFNRFKEQAAEELTPGASLEDACDKLFRFLIERNLNQDGTGRWSQQFINTVCSLAVECSRRNSSVVDVKCLLKDDTGRLAKAFTQAYEKHYKALHGMLRSIDWIYPTIHDFDWTLGEEAEKNNGNGVQDPANDSAQSAISTTVAEPEESAASSKEKPGLDCKIVLMQHDITKLHVDAIVNAANSSLMGGGGVDGAIHQAAGRGLKEECRKLNGCHTGNAKVTGAHGIKQVKGIIHAVGPMVHGKVTHENRMHLGMCYMVSLGLATSHGFRSIAFPCISTGIYGYPNLEAARTVLASVKYWLEDEDHQLDKIVFCVFLDKDLHIYRQLLPSYFPDFVDAPLLHAKVNSLKRLCDFIVDRKQKADLLVPHLEAAGEADHEVVTKAKETLENLRQIITNTTERLEKAMQDTAEYVDAHLAALEGTEELDKAKVQLKAAHDLVRPVEDEAMEL